MENGDLKGKIALKDCKLSNALYQDIVSKNFEVIQSFLKKINVIYARQEQLQENIEIVNNSNVYIILEVKNLEIQNRHLHHQFRNVNGLVDKKLNTFIHNDSRFKRRISRFGRDQNIRSNSKKVSLVLNDCNDYDIPGKSQSVCDNISQLSEQLLDTSGYIQSGKLKIAKKQTEISIKVKNELNELIKQNYEKASNHLQSLQSTFITSQNQSKMKFQFINQQIHETKKNCLKRSTFQEIKVKMEKQFQLMVDKRIAQAKQQIKFIFVDLLDQNKKQIITKVQSMQEKANEQLGKFKNKFSVFEHLEFNQENFKTHLDKQEKQLAKIIDGKEENFANRDQTKSALKLMEEKLNGMIISQGILKKEIKLLKGRSDLNKQQKNMFTNALTHKCLGCNSFVELDLFPFSQLDPIQNVTNTTVPNESKLLKKSSHFYNSHHNKLNKSISTSVFNSLKKKSMQMLTKQPKFQ